MKTINKTRILGTNGPKVSAIGFGCMGLNYGIISDCIPSHRVARAKCNFGVPL
jgi:aryl-alcohol dehydrogenase-like predicted oxidoreductase